MTEPKPLHRLVSAPLADHPLAPEGSNLVLVEWEDEGGGFDPPRTMAPRHIHHTDDEAFYVVEGTLAFELDGETIEVGAGGAVMVANGVVHTWWNPSPDPCRYLILMTRNVYTLISSLHDPDETRSPAELFRQHNSEIVEQ
ncbi:MAG TPA: cupin domain-containing protein [Thermomicrobiales bacterium]|nr:cupin domain-containing protein [Thermomicrobiales bacterium]